MIDSLTPHGLAVATMATAAFVLALFIGSKLLPGRMVEGFRQADGERKIYKINGMALWVATHMFVIAGTLVFDLSLAPLVRHFWSFFGVANVLAITWTLVLYVTGRSDESRQSREGGTGLVRDLWYGVELNPTWAGVDLKTFAYQPSLIGLSLLNVAFAYRQFELYGFLTPQMIAYQAFWWWYMTTHFRYEAGVLSMWDIIAEKFGFMLVWGDLVLVPFFYCIPGWYLVHATQPASLFPLLLLTGFFSLGLWIFRGANAQKDRFKRDPRAPIWGKPPETIGGKLLVSGWWGIGRKINYTGEIMVYTSFALCTGMHSLVPYLLPLWLCVLLPHRAWRDEKRCKAKYGELWEEYTRRARFRMVPFVY